MLRASCWCAAPRRRGPRGQRVGGAADRLGCGVLLEADLHERAHPPADAIEEHPPLVTPDQAIPEPDHEVRDVRVAGDRVHAELDLARGEPLPHLPGHLTHLDVTLERAVVPPPHVRLAAADLERALVDVAHADADIQRYQPERPEPEQHVAPLQRHGGVVVGPDDRRISELVASHQPARDLPAAPLGGHPGRLGRERLAQVGDLPSAGRAGAGECGEVEVEVSGSELGQPPPDPRWPQQLLIGHRRRPPAAACRDPRRRSFVRPTTRRPPRGTRSTCAPGPPWPFAGGGRAGWTRRHRCEPTTRSRT